MAATTADGCIMIMEVTLGGRCSGENKPLENRKMENVTCELNRIIMYSSIQ